MRKDYRELIRMAKKEGVSHPRIAFGSPHDRLVGEVGGEILDITVSRTKSAGVYQHLTRRNIRREVAKLRGEAHA